MSDALKFEPTVGLEIPESPEDRIPMLTEMALGGECAAIVFDVMEGKAWKCWSPDCEPGSNTIADGWCEYFAEADRDEELEVYTRAGCQYALTFTSRASFRSHCMEVLPL